MTLFLIIGAVGLALVVVALLIGDVLDGALHLDVLDSDLFSISSLAAFVGAFGFGEITLSVAGHVRKFSAKSALPVEAGAEVWVSGIVSPTAVEVTQTSAPKELT